LLNTLWAEEIFEAPKTVWNLKKGDEYFMLGTDGYETTNIWREAQVEIIRRECNNVFLTSEDASMELLRRESRAKAWMPEVGKGYLSIGRMRGVFESRWYADTTDWMFFYN